MSAWINRRAMGFGFSTLISLGAAGCVEDNVDRVVDSRVRAIDASISDPTGGGGVGQVSEAVGNGGGQSPDGPRDGSSNTIDIDETPPATSDPSPARDDAAATIAEFTNGLGDKIMTFGSSSFFSSGSITDSVQLQTCAFGRFGMQITRVTSTSFNTFSSEEAFIGTWSVKAVSDGFVLELVVEQATNASDVGVQQRVLTVDSNGNLLIDNARAEIADAAADCAAAQQQQG